MAFTVPNAIKPGLTSWSMNSYTGQNEFMDIELSVLRRPIGERLWFPFGNGESDNGFTGQWWRDPVYPDSEMIFLQARSGGAEIARIELNPSPSVNHYQGVPSLGPRVLEISFYEVHNRSRLSGVGTELIRFLVGLYPNHRLVAFSEEADGFWASLGWREYAHPKGFPAYRPLFVQP